MLKARWRHQHSAWAAGVWGYMVWCIHSLVPSTKLWMDTWMAPNFCAQWQKVCAEGCNIWVAIKIHVPQLTARTFSPQGSITIVNQEWLCKSPRQTAIHGTAFVQGAGALSDCSTFRWRAAGDEQLCPAAIGDHCKLWLRLQKCLMTDNCSYCYHTTVQDTNFLTCGSAKNSTGSAACAAGCVCQGTSTCNILP